MENSMKIFQKEKKNRNTTDPAILLLGAYLKNTKTLIHKDINIYTPYVHWSIIYKSQNMETTSVLQWMNG